MDADGELQYVVASIWEGVVVDEVDCDRSCVSAQLARGNGARLSCVS